MDDPEIDRLVETLRLSATVDEAALAALADKLLEASARDRLWLLENLFQTARAYHRGLREMTRHATKLQSQRRCTEVSEKVEQYLVGSLIQELLDELAQRIVQGDWCAIRFGIAESAGPYGAERILRGRLEMVSLEPLNQH